MNSRKKRKCPENGNYVGLNCWLSQGTYDCACGIYALITAYVLINELDTDNYVKTDNFIKRTWKKFWMSMSPGEIINALIHALTVDDLKKIILETKLKCKIVVKADNISAKKLEEFVNNQTPEQAAILAINRCFGDKKPEGHLVTIYGKKLYDNYPLYCESEIKTTFNRNRKKDNWTPFILNLGGQDNKNMEWLKSVLQKGNKNILILEKQGA